MASIVNADILRLVARLVLGYLDEQHLPEAHNAFCETSRHLTKEYAAYQEGTKPVDTSIGLINIIAEYFLLKEKLNEFIRTCPKTSFIIQLIDASSQQHKFELIFKVLKENLLKFDDEIQPTAKRKRRTETEFDISKTNTSTPETNHEPSSKRRRISLPNPFVSLNASGGEKKLADKSLPKNYISSPDTSNKEDDVTEEEKVVEEIPIKPPPELLSETLLNKPDFAETLAEIINKTREAKELESPQASTSQNVLTQTDLQDILSKTENENDFEDILKEVIEKFLVPGDEVNEESASTTPSPVKEEVKPEEVPLKQRLRQRSAKKTLPPSEKKKRKSPKVNILSNEIVSGPLPVCLTNENLQVEIITQSQQQQSIIEPIYTLVPIMSSNFIPLQSALSQQIPATSTIQVITESNGNLVLEEEVQVIEVDKENKPSEKLQQTPKMPVSVNFLESKCKSTPRRKASHVRVLEFNQTPSAARLSTIKEFTTPLSGIKNETPGSAPASINATQKFKPKVQEEPVIEIADDSSNSTSISHTPKVVKNRRRRKIEIDTKKTEDTPSKEEQPMTREEWDKMRAQQKSLSIDDRMRMLCAQESSVKTTENKKKRKTPKKKKILGSAKKSENPRKSKESQNQPKRTTNRLNGSGAKFKVTSPRKAALLRKTPKKKKHQSSPVVSVRSILTPNIDAIKQKKEEDPPPEEKVVIEKIPDEPEKSSETDLNRSDTVQEVANLLTTLPETILAKTSSASNLDEKNKIDPQTLMETPLKLDSMSPLPNTPRFAIPLVTASVHETPVPKAITTVATTSAIPSLIKVCDILTPSFPITPGFKDTPLKSDQSPGGSASGYSSRRTDYSSCSSYYKPDESEEINQNFETMIKQSRERNSQSESDGGGLVITEMERSVKIRVGSTKKVECPGALERVLSFTEEKKEIPIPHYTMMDEGLLSESILTTASDSNSSSSFTCSTCSTDPSTDDNTFEMLNKSDLPEDTDKEWKCEHVNESNNSLVDEKTGEVRFPLRNLITPRKMEQEIKQIISSVPNDLPTVETHKKIAPNLEDIKQRTLKIIKKESAEVSRRNASKLKKVNAKTFKLPAEQPKTFPTTRREQILSQNLTERARPTPLKLIPSTSSSVSSSSRRKNATPRKTIIIDELPTKAPIAKRTGRKKSESSTTKSPAKPERVSLENISDNAVHLDDHLGLNMSSSFEKESSDDDVEQESTSKTVIKNVIEEGSNTFQQAMLSQGFNLKDAKELEEKLDEKKEVSSSEESDDEDECCLTFADEVEKFCFNVEASKENIKKVYDPISKIAPWKIKLDDRAVEISFTDTFEIFSMEPETNKNGTDKKKSDKNSSKSKSKMTRTSDKESASESTARFNDHNIEEVLSLIHGK